jgi:hypothetical protein
VKNLSRLALLSTLSIAALGGCNLTYDREGLEFPSDLVCEGATPNRCEVTAGSPYCTDLASSASNCGDCGLICSGTCSGGSCSGTVTCSAPLQPCNDGIKDYCANVTSDATDCGFCGNSCGTQTCGSGFCHVACDAAFPDEWLVPGVGWQCFDFKNDKNNCGSYGNVCASGACAAGGCLPAPACPPLATACNAGSGEYCSNLSEDPNNCGSCGSVCAAGSACVAGSCIQGTCPGGDLRADGLQTACIDVQRDPLNCGFAGNSCGNGVCLNGSCDYTGAGTLPSGGLDWNVWNAGASIEEAIFNGASCPVGASAQTCQHMGEVFMVDLAPLGGMADCSNATADDELGLFDWSCVADPLYPTTQFYMYSTGLKPGKRLADLIDGNLQWKPNAVRVWVGGVYSGSTVRGIWRANPILPLPTDGNLTTAAVFVQPQNGKVNPSVNFSAQGAALAVLPGRVLSPVSTLPAVVASDLSFLWIDGRIDATGAAGGVRLSNTWRSVVRGVDVSKPIGNYDYGIHLSYSSRVRVEDSASRGFDYGLYVDSGSDNRLARVRVEDTQTSGAYLYYTTNVTVDGLTARPGPGRNTYGAKGFEAHGVTGGLISGVDVAGFGTGLVVGNWSTNNRFSNVAAAACTSVGVEIQDTTGNWLDGAVVSENGEAGVLIWYGSGNVLTDVLAVSNGQYSPAYGAGIYLYNANDNRILAVTSSDNAVGLALAGANNNLIASGAFVRNTVGGVAFGNSYGTLLADFAAGGNGDFGLYTDGFSETALTGWILLGGNGGTGDCNVPSPNMNSGFTGMGSCTLTSPSADYQVAFMDPATAFVGYTGEDAVNTSDSNGSGIVMDFGDPAMDWFGFARPHRAWLGSGFGVLGCAGGWAPRSVMCGGGWNPTAQIYDWSLPFSSDLRAVLPQPSTRPLRTHAWSDSSAANFVTSAIEFPGINGNEDGLCDFNSGEYCLWTPNIGAYQGHNAPMGWTNIGLTQAYGTNMSRYYYNGY